MDGMIYKLPSGLSPDEISAATRILGVRADFMPHPDLMLRNAHITLFKDEINLRDAELAWHAFLVKDEEFVGKKCKKLMTKEDEKVIFLQYNYARMRVARIHRLIVANHPVNTKLVRAMLLWSQIARKLENTIMIGNFGLLLERLRHFGLFTHPEYDDLFSEGQMGILRCIKKFDIGRGWKFSTYCVSALNKQIWRTMATFKKRARFTFQTLPEDGEEEIYAPDTSSLDRLDTHEDVEELEFILNKNVAGLSNTEMTILRHRFGFESEDGNKRSLDEVGKVIGVTKERIRQVQNKGIRKLVRAYEDREYQPACKVRESTA